MLLYLLLVDRYLSQLSANDSQLLSPSGQKFAQLSAVNSFRWMRRMQSATIRQFDNARMLPKRLRGEPRKLLPKSVASLMHVGIYIIPLTRSGAALDSRQAPRTPKEQQPKPKQKPSPETELEATQLKSGKYQLQSRNLLYTRNTSDQGQRPVREQQAN